ncbi:MAG: hypothetical protein MI922_22780, partial [Bacteroidales bacterium]|nr:hypothetical protein [Bacteroidales bacterium]
MKNVATFFGVVLLSLNAFGQTNSISFNAKFSAITHQNELVNFHVYEKKGVLVPGMTYSYKTKNWKAILRGNFYSVRLKPINSIESLESNSVKSNHLDFGVGYYRIQQFAILPNSSVQYGLEYLFQRNSHSYNVVNTHKIVNKQYH